MDDTYQPLRIRMNDARAVKDAFELDSRKSEENVSGCRRCREGTTGESENL